MGSSLALVPPPNKRVERTPGKVRRFDVITVAGAAHAQRSADLGEEA
jgi:hypothetical protein